jgi:hypothetical protein
MKALLWGLPLALGTFLVGRRLVKEANAATDLEYSVAGGKVHWKITSPTEMRIDLDMRIRNRSGVPVSTDRVEGRIMYGASEAGDFTLTKGLVAAADAETPVVVPVRVKALTLVKGIVDLIRSKSKIEFQLVAKAWKAGFVIPIETSFPVNYPSL